MKLGGRFLGFNVDAAFGDAVDALMLLDLRETPLRLLERYVGAQAAEALLAHGHAAD